MNWPDATLNEIQSREDLAHFLTGLAEKIRDGSLVVENATTDSFGLRWALDEIDGWVLQERNQGTRTRNPRLGDDCCDLSGGTRL
jgi:hypothetical protein